MPGAPSSTRGFIARQGGVSFEAANDCVAVAFLVSLSEGNLLYPRELAIKGNNIVG